MPERGPREKWNGRRAGKIERMPANARAVIRERAGGGVEERRRGKARREGCQQWHNASTLLYPIHGVNIPSCVNRGKSVFLLRLTRTASDRFSPRRNPRHSATAVPPAHTIGDCASRNLQA